MSDKQILDARTFYEEKIGKKIIVPDWAIAFAERYAAHRIEQIGQPPAVKGADPDELWDEFSQHIDDDIDSLSTIAGSSVITETSFKELMKRVQSPVKGAVWLKGGKPPGVTQWYIVKCDFKRWASLVYIDSNITLQCIAKDLDIEIDQIEWLDEQFGNTEQLDESPTAAGDGKEEAKDI